MTQIDSAPRSFPMRRLKFAVAAVAALVTLAPSIAGAVSIYHRKYGFLVEWDGSFESCNAWASWSPDYACFSDLAYPTAPGSGDPVIEHNARGEATIVMGRERFRYAILSAEGKNALKNLGKGSNRTAVEKALQKAFSTSIKVIPAAKVKALAARYKARVVYVKPQATRAKARAVPAKPK